MRVNYKGCDRDFNYRLAEIGYTEKEENTMRRIEKVMNIKGWNLNIIADGYASCEVDSYDEYKEFVKEYKEVKRIIKNCEKYGF